MHEKNIATRATRGRSYRSSRGGFRRRALPPWQQMHVTTSTSATSYVRNGHVRVPKSINEGHYAHFEVHAVRHRSLRPSKDQADIGNPGMYVPRSSISHFLLGVQARRLLLRLKLHVAEQQAHVPEDARDRSADHAAGLHGEHSQWSAHSGCVWQGAGLLLPWHMGFERPAHHPPGPQAQLRLEARSSVGAWHLGSDVNNETKDLRRLFRVDQ